MPNDNESKMLHGIDGKKVFNYAVIKLAEFDLFKSVEESPKYTDPEYPDDKERFSASYVVTLANDENIMLFTTTSIRDRIKQQQWEAHNIKQIEDDVIYAWLVTPDDSTYGGPEAIVAKINSGRTRSALDRVMTIDEFCDGVLEAYRPTVSSGVYGDKAGKVFEGIFELIMSCEGNLAQYNDETDASKKVKFRYGVFHDAMELLGINPGEVAEIEATRDIPPLPSGGKPKTDVLLNLKFADGRTRRCTFSCKNTGADSIQVCQFRADECADVLDKDNARLRKGLRGFQRVGNARDMDESDRAMLADEIGDYLEEFLLWCIGGYGTLGATDDQCAEFLVARNSETKDIVFHKTQALCAHVAETARANVGFGTGLSWTYQGTRGESIQVKIATGKLFCDSRPTNEQSQNSQESLFGFLS